mgnify:CR=1 FL=1
MDKKTQANRIANALEISGIEFQREYKFHPIRKWRFDFAIPSLKIAIEFEGGIFINGGHNRGIVFAANCEKYNEAQILGWKVFRYTVKDLEKRNGEFKVIYDIRRSENFLI